MTGVPEIDWRAFDKWPTQEIECRDGAIYRSHAKLAQVDGQLTLVTEQPCPVCGRKYGHVRRASSQPEMVVIR